METFKRMLAIAAPYMPNFQDLLVFGGLAIFCYGIAHVAGAGWACIAGGAGLFWIGVKKV